MFPDEREMLRRVSALQRLPWVMPASVVLRMSDSDLDELADASRDEYWRVLNGIVRRIVDEDTHTLRDQGERSPGRGRSTPMGEDGDHEG